MSNQEYQKLLPQLPVFKSYHELYLPSEFDDRELEFLNLEWLRFLNNSNEGKKTPSIIPQ